jgi:hypothetical protein
VFCVAADADEFRYGTVLFHDASKEDVERHGAGGRNRTGTLSPELDFESSASTSSATPA